MNKIQSIQAFALVLVTSLLVTACTKTDQQEDSSDPLVVYSSRNEQLIRPVFERYTELTGQDIDFLTDDAGVLIQRLKAEADSTEADLLITVDAGNLWYAAKTDLLAQVGSDVLGANIPTHLRDASNRWFGLSLRARTIVYSTQRVAPSDLSTYEDLSEDKWKGRLCLRTSKKVYNQSLVAMLIAEHGSERTEKIVSGWVNNLAVDVFSNDTKLMEAIDAGQCDVGIVNSYYFGRLQSTKPDLPLALFWPNQDTTGVHVNVAGAGVTKHAKHPEQAIKFLEWLSGQEAQSMFAGVNQEYPVNPGVEPIEQVAGWGSFKASTMPLEKAGEYQADAVMLMDRSNYR